MRAFSATDHMSGFSRTAAARLFSHWPYVRIFQDAAVLENPDIWSVAWKDALLPSWKIRTYGSVAKNGGIRSITRTDISPPFLGGKKCVLWCEKYGNPSGRSSCIHIPDILQFHQIRWQRRPLQLYDFSIFVLMLFVRNACSSAGKNQPFGFFLQSSFS